MLRFYYLQTVYICNKGRHFSWPEVGKWWGGERLLHPDARVANFAILPVVAWRLQFYDVWLVSALLRWQDVITLKYLHTQTILFLQFPEILKWYKGKISAQGNYTRVSVKCNVDVLRKSMEGSCSWSGAFSNDHRRFKLIGQQLFFPNTVNGGISSNGQ